MPVASSASLVSLGESRPRLHPTVFVADGARLVGDVVIGEMSSVWYNAVIRGDRSRIVIGDRSNVQDGVVIHVDAGSPAKIGDDVSIGHNAVVHGCTVEDGCLIGMNSTILSGAVIGAGSLVAGGAVVLEGTVIPAGSLVAGVPAKVRRALTEDERGGLHGNAATYLQLATDHGARCAE
ncbi:gamma carbonic anhydrase family protein [Microbacterium sp. NE2HP2]|uniref:gamma carbonic anhydrase family protein n=1 Tax=Microbacterium TaxID=33882 RepID=UPI0022B03708|nr:MULTISPECIES: gamma carbonic anhydrase family protein [Microbacterium]MCZ4066381.1 gamma carbonic anhydrase family protein [Microbacterium sp. H37-C3]MDD7943696.1 gamma carbonic anhydrase family protein [Microbacterium plantarum]WHE34680.1 gamma carbonic anhydrase family protein [Microbacterium sp. BDGP8]WRK18823.1 gamma carbonic anhydrase family protein [Microbacterium plantarum]